MTSKQKRRYKVSLIEQLFQNQAFAEVDFTILNKKINKLIWNFIWNSLQTVIHQINMWTNYKIVHVYNFWFQQNLDKYMIKIVPTIFIFPNINRPSSTFSL